MKHIKKIIGVLLAAVNALVPMSNNRIYAIPQFNSFFDKYDIDNCGSSNLLKIVNALAKKKWNKPLEVIVEYCDQRRLGAYDSIIKQAALNNVTLTFRRNWRSYDSRINRLCSLVENGIIRYSSTIWLTESDSTRLRGKLRRQTILNCNYYISCKNDFIVGQDSADEFNDYVITTALLPAQIESAVSGISLDKFIYLGFPRNDTLLSSPRGAAVESWLFSEVGYMPKHVIAFAPTVRDWDSKEKPNAKREVMGYACDGLDSFLRSNRAVIVYKLHPYQNRDVFLGNNCFLECPKTYDFSFYDLLSVSSCLIGDYSSVNFDYLLADKPIIFNLYDFDKYKECRGLSYDPYCRFCPGDIVTNYEQLEAALERVFSGQDMFHKEREKIKELLFKYPDARSTDRSLDLIASMLGEASFVHDCRINCSYRG